MTASVSFCRRFIWCTGTCNAHGPIFDTSVYLCMYLCETVKQTEKLQEQIRERSVADRQAGRPVYPRDHQTTISSCRKSMMRRQEIKYNWGCCCRVKFSQFPHHLLLYRVKGCGGHEPLPHPVCDSSGMANIQLLLPCCIIRGQSVTAGRSHRDPDKSLYQSRERQSKYSDGGQEGWSVKWGKKQKEEKRIFTFGKREKCLTSLH